MNKLRNKNKCLSTDFEAEADILQLKQLVDENLIKNILTLLIKNLKSSDVE